MVLPEVLGFLTNTDICILMLFHMHDTEGEEIGKKKVVSHAFIYILYVHLVLLNLRLSG